MRVQDFSRITGLDESTVERLLREGHLEGGLWRDAHQNRPFGLFEDALPTRAALVALGLAVRPDYNPADHRSFEMNDDDLDAD